MTSWPVPSTWVQAKDEETEQQLREVQVRRLAGGLASWFVQGGLVGR